MGRQPPEPCPSPMEGCPFRLTTCYPDTIFLHKPNIMNKNIYVIACALALATVSCENTVPAVTNPEAETVIIANIGGEAGVSSRTAVDPTDYFGGHVGILWTPDDAIGVFGGTVVNARFTCDATRPAGRASFSGNCAGPEYAYYPYSAANDGADPKTLAGQLPAQQSYDSATGSLTGDWKYGRRREGAEGEFDFSHVFALLRFNVNATGTLLSGERLKGVTLELPEGRELAGDFTFDAITGSYRFTGSTSHAVTVQWTDTPELKAGKTCTAYMSVAPDLHADDEVTVTVTTDRHTATFTRHIAYDFAPNSVYTFNLALSEFQDGMEVEELPGEPEEETANCYMITTAGEHDFKATVIGNGQKGIIPGAGFHTEDASISPASARLLWEDVSGFVSKVELRDGRVYYTTTGNVGNAVIAVYDTAGTILWSWHVWGVGDTLPQDVEVTNFNGNKYVVMSRNLGDRADKPAYGVLYQWGRKDPVSSDTIIYVNGQETTTDDVSTRRYRYINRLAAADASQATIELSVRNPMQMTTIVDSDDWLGTENLYLWGNTNFSDEQKADETAFTHGKTIYDPSPVGYRVANCLTFSYFCKNESGSNGSSGNSRIGRINYVKYDKGFYFMTNANDTEGLWFPQGGRRDGYFLDVTTYTGSGNKRVYFSSVGQTGSYWYCNPASPQSGTYRSLRMSISNYKENNGSTVANSYNTLDVYNMLKRSSALSVRCVRDGVE